jgi:hypothetical protein
MVADPKDPRNRFTWKKSDVEIVKKVKPKK